MKLGSSRRHRRRLRRPSLEGRSWRRRLPAAGGPAECTWRASRVFRRRRWPSSATGSSSNTRSIRAVNWRSTTWPKPNAGSNRSPNVAGSHQRCPTTATSTTPGTPAHPTPRRCSATPVDRNRRTLKKTRRNPNVSSDPQRAASQNRPCPSLRRCRTCRPYRSRR